MNFMTSKEAAQKWGCSEPWVAMLCRKGKIDGAYKQGRGWLVPVNTVQPTGKKQTQPSGSIRDPQTLLPLSIGHSDYKRIEATCYYVDKTLFIKELLDENTAVSLFTRPRRFGKTLTLNMLQTFFEKSELDTATFFRYRNLWKCGERYQQYQGNFPVIYLSFKDAKCRNWDDTQVYLSMLLQDEYIRHKEILNTIEDNNYKEYYERVMCCQATTMELTKALIMLAEGLSKAYSSQVVILIDEYDTPIQQGYMCGYYEEIISFMRMFLSQGLKDNKYLFKAVLTGILRVSKENLFSGLNNITVNTVVDKKYAEYFGFTTAEVAKMAAYYGHEDKLPEIKAWYDGYQFGEQEIYNPWSVLNYFNNLCEPKPFWVNTSENGILKQLLGNLDADKAEELTRLLEGKTVLANLDFNIIYPKLQDNQDVIYSFLLLAGYLKCTGMSGDTLYKLAIPNKEVQQVYKNEVMAWMEVNFAGRLVIDMLKAMALHDNNKFAAKLNSFLQQAISYFDYSAEGFYHGLMLGLTAFLGNEYYIKSNRESGWGRFDLCLEPKSKNKTGFILEFKVLKQATKQELDNLAESALKQITSRQYAQELKERDIKHIVGYGIAFCGKEASISMNTLA